MCVTIQLGDYTVTIYTKNPLVLYPIEKIKKIRLSILNGIHYS